MKANNIKAVIAISDFFTYHATPEEFEETLRRSSALEDNARDRDIMRDLADLLRDALK